MVNLQHKNIVRFITSWAEKEENEDSLITESLVDQTKFTKQSNTNELSIHFGDTEQPQEIVKNY